MDDIVRVNGNVMSAKSCSFSIDLFPYVGFTAVDYGDKLDAELVHDMAKDGTPVGYTSGEYSVDGFKLTVLKDVWLGKLLPQLLALGAQAGGIGYGAGRFSFMAQYQEGIIVGTDVISGCRVVGTKDSIQQGTGKATVELELMALVLTRNGFGLFNLARKIF